MLTFSKISLYTIPETILRVILHTFKAYYKILSCMNCSTQRRKFYKKKLKKSFVTTSYTVSKLDSKLNSTTQKVGRLHITTTLHQKISKEGRKKILQVQEGAFK